jgi:hypothetical protein
MFQRIAGKGFTAHPAFASTYRFRPLDSSIRAGSNLQRRAGSRSMATAIHYTQLASQLSKLVPSLDGEDAERNSSC